MCCEDVLRHAARNRHRAFLLCLCMISLTTLLVASCHVHIRLECSNLICKLCVLQVLGVQRDATEADTKRQYRKLAAVVHPDKCALEGSEEAFKLLGKSAACLTSQSNTNRLVLYGSQLHLSWHDIDAVRLWHRADLFVCVALPCAIHIPVSGL